MAKTGDGGDVPLVTVDVVLLTGGEHDLLVYLQKRAEAPYASRLSLPGTPLRAGESTEAAAQRVLASIVTGPEANLQQLYTFSEPRRDPRGPSLSVAYLSLFPTLHQRPNARPGEDAWVPLRDAMGRDLAFDHARVLEVAQRRLEGRLSYTNDAYHLLPERFTIPQLQHVHELILGQRLKPDVFTKRVRDGLKAFRTREVMPGNGAGRPARLYRNPVVPERPRLEALAR